MIGSQVSALAVPLLAAVTLHASPTDVGILAALGQAPTLLFSLPAGVLVDRIGNKRRLMIGLDVVRAVALVAVPAAALTGRLSITLLGVAVVVVGTGTVVHELAQNALVPTVVTRDRLLDANAKLHVSYAVGESAGPGLGGLLVQALSAPAAIAVDAASYLVSAVLMSRVVVTALPVARARLRPVREAAAGVRALLGDRLLGPWARWGSVSVVMMGGFEAQYVLFAVRDLHLAAGWIGVVAASAGLGAVPASRYVARARGRWSVGKTIVGGLMLYFLLLVPVPIVAGPTGLVVAVLAVVKILQTTAFTVSNVQQWSLRQLTTSVDLLGRVSAGNRFLVGSAETLGAAVSGPLAVALGVRPYLVLCGLLGFAVLLPLLGRPLWALERLPAGPREGRR